MKIYEIKKGEAVAIAFNGVPLLLTYDDLYKLAETKFKQATNTVTEKVKKNEEDNSDVMLPQGQDSKEIIRQLNFAIKGYPNATKGTKPPTIKHCLEKILTRVNENSLPKKQVKNSMIHYLTTEIFNKDSSIKDNKTQLELIQNALNAIKESKDFK